MPIAESTCKKGSLQITGKIVTELKRQTGRSRAQCFIESQMTAILRPTFGKVAG